VFFWCLFCFFCFFFFQAEDGIRDRNVTGVQTCALPICNREYLADAGSVELTRNPQGLISALEKISNSEPMKDPDPSSAGLYIENPLHNRGLSSLFDTHPPTADRIKRLKNM